MRRIDVIALGIGIFGVGGLLYWGLSKTGLDGFSAGLWSQAILVGAVLLWVVTYLGRVVSQRMTYHQQLQDYEDAVLQQRLAELSPEELAQLQAEVEAARQPTSHDAT